MTGLLRYFGEVWGYTISEILSMTVPQLNAIMDSVAEDNRRAQAEDVKRRMNEMVHRR